MKVPGEIIFGEFPGISRILFVEEYSRDSRCSREYNYFPDQSGIKNSRNSREFLFPVTSPGNEYARIPGISRIMRIFPIWVPNSIPGEFEYLEYLKK